MSARKALIADPSAMASVTAGDVMLCPHGHTRSTGCRHGCVRFNCVPYHECAGGDRCSCSAEELAAMVTQ